MASRVFSLSESAYQRGTDYDVVMLYQVLLGRNPENSQVIQDHRSHPLNVALQTFVTSAEFRESVLDPINNGGSVRRHDIVPKPSTEQINWLFSRTVLDDAQKTAMRKAESWEQFFQYLCSLDGFLEQLPPPPPRPATPPTPFKPPVRAAVPPPVPVLPTASVEHAELLGRLDRLDAMLATLTQMVAATRVQSPTGAGNNAEPDGARRDNPPADLAMEAAETLAPREKAKPSSRRQAR